LRSTPPLTGGPNQPSSPQAPPALPFPTPALERLAAELSAAEGPQERSRLLLGYARRLPPLPDAARTDANRVMGCTAQVWVSAALDASGRLQLGADSDSELTRGLAAVLVEGLSGLTPAELLAVRSSTAVAQQPCCPLRTAATAACVHVFAQPQPHWRWRDARLHAVVVTGAAVPCNAHSFPSALWPPPPHPHTLLHSQLPLCHACRWTLLCWASWAWAPPC
jgi:sulfur transfer protein SufE